MRRFCGLPCPLHLGLYAFHGTGGAGVASQKPHSSKVSGGKSSGAFACVAVIYRGQGQASLPSFWAASASARANRSSAISRHMAMNAVLRSPFSR